MSRFFQNLEEEKEETQTKIKEVGEKLKEKLSKKDAKLKELEDKVSEVENSGKNFEKNFKKLINEVKKYTAFFENNELPEFLIDFFSNSKIQSSKPMSALASEFLSQFSKVEPEIATVVKKSSKKKARSLETILSIEDDQEKDQEIEKFLDAETDEDLKSEALVALFHIHSRAKNPTRMIEILKMMDLSRENNFMGNVRKNLDVYLGKITGCGDECDPNLFSDLLKYLMNSSFDIKKEAIEKRQLEIDYFLLEQATENKHPMFSLLFYVRTNQWESASEYYTENEKIFDASSLSLKILNEFGVCAGLNGEFKLAFDVLMKCYESTPSDSLKTYIFALCVILNEDLIGQDIFEEFLDEFKRFGSNSLCLYSFDPLSEACRAFYYLNCLDSQTAGSIVENITKFKGYDMLQEQVIRIHKKIISN